MVRHSNNSSNNVSNRPHASNVSLLTVNSVRHQCIGLSAAHILVKSWCSGTWRWGTPVQCGYCNRYNSKGKLFTHYSLTTFYLASEITAFNLLALQCNRKLSLANIRFSEIGNSEHACKKPDGVRLIRLLRRAYAAPQSKNPVRSFYFELRFERYRQMVAAMASLE